MLYDYAGSTRPFPFQNSNANQSFFKDRYSSKRFCRERIRTRMLPVIEAGNHSPREDIHAISPRHSSLSTYPPELHTLRHYILFLRPPKELITWWFVKYEGYEPQQDDCGRSRSYPMLLPSSWNMKNVSVLLLRSLSHLPLRNLEAKERLRTPCCLLKSN